MDGSNLFDNNIRSRFEGFSPEPPAEVWYSVRDAVVVAPHQSRVPVFFRVAAAIAFLAISGLSVWFLTTGPQSVAPLADAEHVSDTFVMPGADAAISDEGVTDAPEETASTFARSLSGYTASVPATSHPIIDDRHEQPLLAAHQNRIPVALAAAIGQRALLHQQATIQSSDRPFSKGSSIADYFYPAHTTLADIDPAVSATRGTGITLGVHIAPSYNDRHIAQTGSLTNTGVAFSALEQTAMSYGFGISAAIPLSPRLSIQAGAGYSSMSQMINNINAYAHFDNRPFYNPGNDKGYSHPQNIVTSFGVIEVNTPSLYFTDDLSERVLISNEAKYPLDLPDDPKLLDLQGQQLTQSFSFVEIPLIARYRLFESRHAGLYLKAGVAGNILVRNDVVLSNLNSQQPDVIGQTAGIRQFSYSGITGLAIAVPLTNRLRLFVEPTAQMFLQPILKDEMLSTAGKTYPYRFSIASGISFRF